MLLIMLVMNQCLLFHTVVVQVLVEYLTVFQPKMNTRHHKNLLLLEPVDTLQNQFPSSPHRSRLAAVSGLKLAVCQLGLPPPAAQPAVNHQER